MNKIRCEKGHYYDADKYTECPHCNKVDLVKTETIYSDEEQENKTEKIWLVEDPIDENLEGSETTLAFDVERVSGSSGEKTESFFVQRSSHNAESKKANKDMKKSSIGPSFYDEGDDRTLGQVMAAEQYHEEDETKHSFFDSSALRPEQHSSESELFIPSHSVFGEKTVPLDVYTSQKRKPMEPIVGWIVCIKGTRFGECFTLNAGKNSIGRSEKNKVVIVGDNNLSREQHAYIIYEPKSRKFYLQPGNSSGLTYLNQEIVLMPTELKDRDQIGLNESRFIFISLCNAMFSWDSIEE